MTNENFELENMRQQLNTLKKKLDQQEIVNDRLIRHSMEKTANKINRRYYFIMAVCVLMIPYSYWAFVKSSTPTGSSSASPLSSSSWAGLCTSRTSFTRVHSLTASSGADASVVLSEPSVDSPSTSRPNVSIRTSSTK